MSFSANFYSVSLQNSLKRRQIGYFISRYSGFVIVLSYGSSCTKLSIFISAVSSLYNAILTIYIFSNNLKRLFGSYIGELPLASKNSSPKERFYKISQSRSRPPKFLSECSIRTFTSTFPSSFISY